MDRIVLSAGTVKIFEKTVLLAASVWEGIAEQPARIHLTIITLPYKRQVFRSGGQLQAITGAYVHRFDSQGIADEAVVAHGIVN